MKKIFLFFPLLIGSPCFAQWQNIGQGNPDGGSLIYGRDLAMCSHDSCIFLSPGSYYVGEPLIFRHTASSGWVPADSGIDQTQGNVTSFATLGTILFLGMTETTNGANGPSYYSTNDGSKWLQNGIGSPIGTNGTYLYGCSETLVYYSTDTGQQWNKTTCPQAHNIQAMGPIVFASNINGFWRSSDSGVNWTKISVPFALPLSAFTQLGTQLFAGGLGIFRSTDSGQSWTKISHPGDTVNALASYKTYLFAGTDTGIFISSDSGVTWRNKNANMGAWQNNHPDVYLLAILDTMLFADVYAGTGNNFKYGYLTARPISEMTDTAQSMVVQTAPPSDSIELYPNPASGTVTISGAPIFSIVVTNITGTEVLTLPKIDRTSITVDLSQLPSGTYFARIQTGGGTVLRKIVKEE